MPSEGAQASALEAEEVRWRLPQDLDVADSVDERDRIAEMATAFLGLADEIERIALPPAADDSARETLVHGPFQSSVAQEARVRMHGIQSAYDVVVAGTPLEGLDPDLKVFRGYVSILLHLLEAVAYLLQVHGALLGRPAPERVRGRAEPLVDPVAALRLALRSACRTPSRASARRASSAPGSSSGTPASATSPSTCPRPQAHLRPAGLIVRVVQHHGSP
jgi:hypothetical protein